MAASLLHRGFLSAAFGLAALAGFASPAAHAHDGHHGHGHGDTSHDSVRDTRATQRHASVFLSHYASRMKEGTKLGIIDHDRLEAFNSTPQTSDVNTILISNGAQLSGDSMLYLRGKLDEKTSRGLYSINDSEDLHLHQDIQEAFSQPMLTSSDGTMMCVTVLGNPGIAIATIEGMTQDQVIRFVNRHEMRHCTDTSGLEDLFTSHNRWQELEKTAFGARETETARYSYQSQILYRESVADLGALIDMIVIDGDTPAIIDSIAQWRQNELYANDDITHYTTDSMIALSRTINDIGVDAFRALPEEAREKILYDIAAKSALSAGSFAYLAGHLTGANNTPLRPNVDISDTDRAAVASTIKRLDSHEYIGTAEQTQIILTDAQIHELRNWDARTRLTQAALSHSDSLTQGSLYNARVALLDSLREDIAANPSDTLHGAKLVLLENTFKDMMHDLDAPAPQKVHIATRARPAGPG